MNVYTRYRRETKFTDAATSHNAEDSESYIKMCKVRCSILNEQWD